MKLEEIKKEKKKGWSCSCGRISCKGQCIKEPDTSCRCGKVKCKGECSK